jgi:methylphosphotriester-DNA--protein-cysteine methyltransferase
MQPKPSPTYAEWRAPAHLDRYVACTYRSNPAENSAASAEPVLPDGCIDLVWDGARLIIAGPDTQPVWSVPNAPSVVGLRFRPGIGSLFLGVPANVLRDQRMDLSLLWGDSDQLVETLATGSNARMCADVLTRAVAQRLPEVERPDPLVEGAMRMWANGGWSTSTVDVAELAGITSRQVHRRFLSAVGYGPKFLQRVLRFQAFLGSCGDGALGLAELAFKSGYADQAHLTREARLLAGVTPGRLRATRQDVRNVQDADAP